MQDTSTTDVDLCEAVVTGIIPYSAEYTPEPMLEDAIESVENQTVVDTEVLVIEDEESKGPAWARNVGLDEADTRYVAFLDADDIWKEEKSITQLRKMKETGAAMCVDGETEYSPIEFAGALLQGDTFGLTSSIMVDTEQVDARFDESLERREDHLYMIDVAMQGGVCFLPQTFITRKHSDGLSQHVDVTPTQIEEFFEEVVAVAPEVARFEHEYYQNAYVYLGRTHHFDREYRAAVEHYAESLKHGPSVQAIGAFGLTVLSALYTLPKQSFKQLVTGGTHE